MEVRVLRYFLTVAREESVTRAAKRLHLSQPTLSKQIKDLEAELGKKLFVRGSFSVHLTEEGMLLRRRAEEILDMVDKTTEEFKALGDVTGGDIRVGCAESDGMKCLARRVKVIREAYPRIRLHLYSGNTEDIAERLERGLLDFAVIAQEADLSKYNGLELPDADIWGVVMRKDCMLAKKETVRVDDLLGLPLICSRQGMTEDYPRWFGEKVDALNIAATFNLAYNAGILVREGMGYLLTFDKLVNTGSDSDLCFRPLLPTLKTKLYMIWKKYQVFSPAAQLLLDDMQKHFGTPE